MFSLKKVSVVLCVLALVACGKTKSSSTVKAPAAPDKTVAQQQDTTPQPQVPVDTSKDQTDTKKQDDAKAKTSDSTTTVPTTAVKSKDPVIKDPVAKDPVVVDKPVDFSPKVVGLGSASIKPEDLTNQGYNAAILRATFCSITGKFNNDGSRCYLVYSDGTTEYESASNREKILVYIEQLKAEEAQGSKSSSKANQKKKN